jgi:hypothetical protein
MNDVFIYLSGLEILTKKNAQTTYILVYWLFHLMQMRNLVFSHEVVIPGLIGRGQRYNPKYKCREYGSRNGICLLLTFPMKQNANSRHLMTTLNYEVNSPIIKTNLEHFGNSRAY